MEKPSGPGFASAVSLRSVRKLRGFVAALRFRGAECSPPAQKARSPELLAGLVGPSKRCETPLMNTLHTVQHEYRTLAPLPSVGSSYVY